MTEDFRQELYRQHSAHQMRLKQNPRLHENPTPIRTSSLLVEFRVRPEEIMQLTCPPGALHTRVFIVTGTGAQYRALLRTRTIARIQDEIAQAGDRGVSVIFQARLDGGRDFMDAGLTLRWHDEESAQQTEAHHEAEAGSQTDPPGAPQGTERGSEEP